MFKINSKDNLKFKELVKGRLFVFDSYPYIVIDLIKEYNAINLETGNLAVISPDANVRELIGYFQET